MEEDSYDSNGQANLDIGNNDNYHRFTSGLTSGSWHFVAMTLNYVTQTGSAYLYKPNGTIEIGYFDCGDNPASDPTDTDTTEDINSVALGCNSDDDNVSETSDNWSGSYDDVRYYDKELVSDEVHSLYQMGYQLQNWNSLSSLADKTSSLDTDIVNVRTEVTGTVGSYTSSLSSSVATDVKDVRVGSSASIDLRALPSDVTASIRQISYTNNKRPGR